MFCRKAISVSRIGAVLCVAQASLCLAQQNRFESSAQLHRFFRRPVSGNLIIDESGVEFRATKLTHRWTYSDIKTFDLSGPLLLTITDYENRHWHEPGEQTFSFTLTRPIPPGFATQMAAMVARPVINGDPEAKATSVAQIAAHRRERFGGSNGILRFSDEGVDYSTPDAREARSWRWTDIQTIASSDSWQFRVTAYREIVEFDLKQPMNRELFDRLWANLYASDLNLNPPNHGDHK